LSKPKQLRNALNPYGSGTLNHNVGAFPSIAFVTDISNTDSNVVVTPLDASNNPEGILVIPLHLRNVPEKLTTFGQLANSPIGIAVRELQLLKAELNEVALIAVSNNPDGMAVIAVKEKASVKMETDVAYLNKFEGMDVIPVERNALAKSITVENPESPSGNDVKLRHP
jgi:hypothetical protein